MSTEPQVPPVSEGKSPDETTSVIPAASKNGNRYGPITAKPESAEWWAEHFFRAKLFKDAASISQVLVKLAMGRDLGLGHALSMSGIYMVDGKPAMSANLMAYLIKKSPRYRYTIPVHTATACTIRVLEKIETSPSSWAWENLGEVAVTREEFKFLGGVNWSKYPKNMLFARCISNVAKWYCADVFGGTPVYLPDEIPNSGLQVDGNTLEVIDAEIEPANKATSQQLQDLDGRMSRLAMTNKETWLSKLLKKEISSLDDLSVEDVGFVSQVLEVRESSVTN